MRYRIAVALTTIVAALFLFGDAALARDNRFALLIANQSYDTSVGVLKNPHNDIALIGDALRKQGFEVLPPVKDAKRSAILGAVRELTARLAGAGAGAIGFLYYSGHGAAEKDTNINYIIPVDAKDPGTTAFWDESLKLDDILRLLDGARGAVKFVVFDACRNELQLPTRDTSKGLLPVAEQQGLFVAYASAPGRTASDRGDQSGPYAAALAKEFTRSGLDHLNLFQNVKEAVISATGGAQHPWESNGLAKRVYLTGEPTTPADMALWESVRTSGSVAALQRYLERFPSGVFASTAEQMIERLKAEDSQRLAGQQFEIERKAQDAKQSAELRAALDEARQARDAVANAERQRTAAETAAVTSKKSVEAALAERDAAAARETEIRQAQRNLVTAATTAVSQSDAEREAAAADLARRLQAAADELRVAREALASAEKMRLAAEQAAVDANKAARAASAERDSLNKVAMLPPPAVVPRVDTPKPAGPFGGIWVLSLVSQNCMYKKVTLILSIENNLITVMSRGGSGSIGTSGSVSFTGTAGADGKPVIYGGTFKGDTGSGTYARADGRCGGIFTAKRS